MNPKKKTQKNTKITKVGPVASDEKLIIAIDFGTTFSGVSYCFANQKDPKPASVENWPGMDGRLAPKIPTTIAYDPDDATKFEWGKPASQKKNAIVAIKLLLDPNQKRPYYLPQNQKRILKTLPKPAVQIAADFIGAMYEHAMEQISTKVPQSYFNLCHKEYILSVPAVWSDVAKNATIKAAEMAGISPVTLIKEPEAAALYTVKSLSFSVSKGDIYVVCDAGGGTVDLVSYEVEQVLPRLQAREVVPGSGGMAGSIGLNQRFEEELRQVVGDDQWLKLKQSEPFFAAQKQFDEQVKPAFTGDTKKKHYIYFPGADLEDDPENGVRGSAWTMTGEDLKQIFDPLISDVIALVKAQVQAVQEQRGQNSIKGICLVGGFGSSLYLRNQLESAFGEKVQVLQPDNAWAAILLGATLSRLPREAIVTSTSSTRHYGTEAWSRYDPTRDLGRPLEKWRDGFTRAATMTWFIYKGDDLLRDQTVKHSFSRSLDDIDDASELIFKDILFECDDDTAPIHRSKKQNISKNCTVTSDLSSVDKKYFERRIDTESKTYYDISYDLVVTLDTAVMKFSLEIDGKPLGTVDAKYN